MGSKEVDGVDPSFARAKALKKENGLHKGGIRLKPWHEKIGRKKKVVSQPTQLRQVFNNFLRVLVNPVTLQLLKPLHLQAKHQ